MSQSQFPEHYLLRLRKIIEKQAGFTISTSKDFERLSEEISFSGAGYVSPSTLKRIWRYVKRTPGHHPGTLDILARFAGYKGGHEEFFRECENESEAESGLKKARILEPQFIAEDVLLELRWMPDRRMELRHLGDGEFLIERAVNTKLPAGNRVRCLHFIEGEPLIMDVLGEGGSPELIYEAGTENGITWRLL